MPKPTKEILKHLEKDPILKKCISLIDLQGDDEYIDIFVYLVKSIVSQQLSIKSAASIYNRLIHHDDIDPIDPTSFLRVPDDELRALGLSYQKARYVKNVCQFFIDNEISMDKWKSMTDQEIIDLLIQIKGVGIWTVQMVLMFALHRPDVLPEGDLGIQLGMKKLYNIKQEKKELFKTMRKIAEKWSPSRTIACMYIWRYKDTSAVSNGK
ncbi:MAG: DNA-3-methyladenine glycosylase [Saprospiraceae bacterium]